MVRGVSDMFAVAGLKNAESVRHQQDHQRQDLPNALPLDVGNCVELRQLREFYLENVCMKECDWLMIFHVHMK